MTNNPAYTTFNSTHTSFIVRGLSSHTKRWEVLGHCGKCQRHEDNIASAIELANVYLAKVLQDDTEYVQVRIELKVE
jgi:phage terminase small subunit